MKKVKVAATILVGIILFAAGFGVAWFAKPVPKKYDKVFFAMDWVIFGKHAPFYAAKDLGYYEEEGIDITIVRGAGSADAVNRVQAGSAQFGHADTGVVITSIARAEADIKLIGMLQVHHPNQIAWLGGELKRADGTLITEENWTPKDLEGRSWVMSPWGPMGVLAEGFMKVNDVDPDKVTIVKASTAAIVPLLIEKQVDYMIGYILSEANYKKTFAEAGYEYVAVNFMQKFGFDIYSNGIIVSKTLLNDNPDLVRRFLRASYRGIKFGVENPEECTNILLRYTPELDYDVVIEELKATNKILGSPEDVAEHGYGWIDPERMELTRDIYTEAMEIPLVPLEDIYTNEYLPGIE